VGKSLGRLTLVKSKIKYAYIILRGISEKNFVDGSDSCPVAGFDVSRVEPSTSACTVLLSFYVLPEMACLDVASHSKHFSSSNLN
jgi:hypothetical protein